MRKIVIGVLTLMGATAYAQKPAVVVTNEPGWQKIGDITASFKKTDESIVVLGADEFTAIKFKVTDAPINIERVQVFYESGDMEQINAARELKKGEETRSFSLKYPGRDIKKVAFTYRTVANAKGEKAELVLYGLKTTQPIDGDKSYRNDSQVKKDADKAKEDAKEEAAEIRDEAKEDAADVREDARDDRDEMKDQADRTGQDVKDGANDAGNAVSEAAAKTMAAIKDEKHADKVGSEGQSIYIDNHANMYYINNEGNKVFVTEGQLKNKEN